MIVSPIGSVAKINFASLFRAVIRDSLRTNSPSYVDGIRTVLKSTSNDC
jgi:hypothetical protein